MRTIKFRHWDKNLKKMMYADNDFSLVKETEDFLPMQFTGLLDKNGKEIYEGDIIKTFDDKIEAVYWEDVDAGFRFSSLPMDYNDEVEVIGNIYENPELLTPSKE